MHIALISPAWPPGTYPNGIVTYVDWMRRGLIAQGHRVSVFAATEHPIAGDNSVYPVKKSLRRKIADSLRARFLGRIRSVFESADVITDTIRTVHRRDPIDVIEMEESFGWAATISRRTGVPLVVKLHGPAFLHMVEEELKTPFGEEKVRREGKALAQLPFIISPAAYTLRETLRHYGLQPPCAQQIVNPVSLGESVPLWRLETCQRDTVLFVGRFDKVKGGDLMLRAFQHLFRNKPHLKLVFVGPDNGLVQAGGGKIQFAEFMASLGDDSLAQAVSYLGRQEPSAVTALRAKSLVTVVASRHENQAYTLLEAMLQGCPVVCCDNSGSTESIEHGVTGLLARSDDPEALAAQIDRIVEDPDLGRALGAAARNYVMTHHQLSVVVEQTVDVYRRAILHSQTAGSPVIAVDT